MKPLPKVRERKHKTFINSRHAPTKKNHESVKNLALLGYSREKIAGCMGISVDTLDRYYHEDYIKYRDQMLGKIANSAYKRAVDGNDTMTCFVLKTQAGWTEKTIVENTGEILVKRVIGVDEADI